MPGQFKLLTYAGVVCLLTCVTAPVSASIINFDDLDATAGDIVLDGISPYQGYNWVNFSVYTTTPGFPGFNNGIVSPANAAYTAGDALGSPLISSISSTTPFNFLSGYFGSGWYDGLNVTVNGLYNGTQEFTQTFTVNTETPQLFSFNFTGITELDVFSTTNASTTDPYSCGPSGCSQVTLDDLALTPAPVSSAPEPATLLMAGAAFLALLTYHRRTTGRTL